MPNREALNWVRLCIAVDGSRPRYQKWLETALFTFRSASISAGRTISVVTVTCEQGLSDIGPPSAGFNVSCSNAPQPDSVWLQGQRLVLNNRHVDRSGN